jgi:hypothetical protein
LAPFIFAAFFLYQKFLYKGIPGRASRAFSKPFSRFITAGLAKK